ncbi:uncharacterized protein LOC119668747 [Teleopsis dalmanni]|uniref:uncharacterized protein LOC119668747 n=1 Tax=Teleopsis dalmanni TaxID=139649 RepID=UPI0018CE4208|nr:uncharacterized protein LOC119668747 [Teleopsis dalmanni]
MFLENTPTDCTFIVGIAKDEIKRIQCHKKVLAECSEVFNSMFNGNYLESEENCEIRLNDVQSYVFEYFVNYIYWNDLPDESSVIEIAQLDYLGDKYIIPFLSNTTEQLIKEKCFITLFELVECLKFPISHKYVKIINSIPVRMMKDILPSSIYNLNLSSFVVVLEKLSNVLDKLRLFEMIEKYVFFNFMQKKKILKM